MKTVIKKHHPMRPLIASVFFFLLIFSFVWLGLSFLGKQSSGEQLTLVENAILRNVVECYAIEGSYPKDLTYLAENYHVAINEDRYVYHYVYLGDNMMPEIFVFPR